ncbi:MAG: malonic semialdehyde reductase [Alphaproteobacteria bacterium]|nr:malonic semialdehyde reductase [Alphaproteobacteria bacterium]
MTQSLSSEALAQLFTQARTFNAYLDTPVPVETLHALWDLMKMGPTSANQLPARLVWCVSAEAKEKLAACASANNAPKILKAPVSVIIGMDENFHEYLPELYPAVDAKSWFEGSAELRHESAFRNSSLQGGYFIMAARALGLGTGPMSGFDNTKVDAAFFADQPSYKSNFIATLGYGDPQSVRPRGPRPKFGKFNRID